MRFSNFRYFEFLISSMYENIFGREITKVWSGKKRNACTSFWVVLINTHWILETGPNKGLGFWKKREREIDRGNSFRIVFQISLSKNLHKWQNDFHSGRWRTGMINNVFALHTFWYKNFITRKKRSGGGDDDGRGRGKRWDVEEGENSA